MVRRIFAALALALWAGAALAQNAGPSAGGLPGPGAGGVPGGGLSPTGDASATTVLSPLSGASTPKSLATSSTLNPFPEQFGGVCDDVANATTALTGMQSAGGGSIILGEKCKTPLLGGSGSLTGPFRGPGQVDAGGSLLGPAFAANVSAPTLGDWTSLGTAFSGDLSKVLVTLDKRILGTTTLGTPTSTYLTTPEASAEIISIYNGSGHNESLSGNIGRTGAFGLFFKAWQYGQGDLTAIGIFGIVASQLPGATNWLAVPAIEALGGELFAGADAQYIEFLGDLDIADNGKDIAAQGLVFNAIRTNGAEAIGQSWNGISLQSIGSIPIEASVRVTGLQAQVLDATRATLSAYILNSGNISVAGTGYTDGAIVTAVGGTLFAGTVASPPTQWRITAPSGVVTALTVVNDGMYTVPPTASTPGVIATTGGGGTGLTISATFTNGNAALFPIGSCLRMAASNAGSFSNTVIPGFTDNICSFAGGLSIGAANNSITAGAGANLVLIGTNNLGSAAANTFIFGTGGYDDAQIGQFIFSTAQQNGFGSLLTKLTKFYGICTASCRLTVQSNGAATTTNSYLIVASSIHNGQARCMAIDKTNGDGAIWNWRNVGFARAAAGTASYLTMVAPTLASGVATAADTGVGAGTTATIAFSVDTSTAANTFQINFVPPNAHAWDASCTMLIDKQA